MKKIVSILLIFLFFFSGCQNSVSSKARPVKIATIKIVDRNGFDETLSTPDRLEMFSKSNFLNPQPYESVLRVFERDARGDIYAVLTTYHENGNIASLFSMRNGRAYGPYKEWHTTGALRLDTFLVGGDPETSEMARRTWVFDGISCVYSEEGALIKEVPYDKGKIEGLERTFSSKGILLEEAYYANDLLEGTARIYYPCGALFEEKRYTRGLLDGFWRQYDRRGRVYAEEFFEEGLLKQGTYQVKEFISYPVGVIEGQGLRCVFGENGYLEVCQVVNGRQEGRVDIWERGQLVARYFVDRDLEKQGEELLFYADGEPLLSIHWVNGSIQGEVKTWYPGGMKESRREYFENELEGISSAWYPHGGLMLLEEYEKGVLVTGRYYRMDDPTPCSTVINGSGTATIFDKEGHLLKKIPYEEGRVIIE